MNDWEERAYRKIMKDEFPQFTGMLERVLDLERWGFEKSYSGWNNNLPPSIIYDSQWCRVRFTWPVQDIRDRKAAILVRYGRKHAPDDQEMLAAGGKLCHCWHDVFLALEFLDGLSPQAAVDKNLARPEIMKRFDETKDPACGQPELLARLHAAIWQHYGERFFEVFDLRRPGVWAGYVRFVKEYRRLGELRDHYAGPWPGNVC